MPRILLVDDEPLVTRSLQTMILDEMADVEVYATQSSQEAMELLARNMYDVVVTDVSMPKISGLELLDRVKALWPMTCVIVLTAYSSFDYAYRAGQYENVRFILKIEPPETVLEAVRKGLDTVRRYFSASQDDERIRRYMKESMPLLRQALLEKLLFLGEGLPERKVCESCGISVRPGEDTWLAVTGAVESQEKQQETVFLVLSSLRDLGFRADALVSGPRLIFLAQADAAAPPPIAGQLDRIIEGAGPEAGLSFALTVRPVPWPSLRTVCAELERRARKGLERSRIVLADPLTDRTCGLTFSDAFRWRRLIERGDSRALTEAVRDSVLEEGFPQGRQSCAVLLRLLLREYFGAGCLDQIRTDRGSAETVFFHGAFANPDEWVNEMGKVLRALFAGEAPAGTETDAVIDSVNRYMEEHYAEQISLTRIADRFSYNSSYLSRIYKQKTGEGISEHIARIRIEKACELLRETGMSVSGIAESCGFQTAKYFITVFKRSTGMTPKAWRSPDDAKG